MAVGRDLKKKNNNVIAVIGDGAITGGMAYEAMNNAVFQLPRFPFSGKKGESPRRVNSGGECGAPPEGREGGRKGHGVQGCLGRRSSPGTWLSPRSLPPRAPLAPCFHRQLVLLGPVDARHFPR